MKIILLTLLFLVGCASTNRNIVERIDVSFKNKEIGSGTVWAISDRELITAGHVCALSFKYPSLFHLSINGNPVVVIKLDEARDLCMLYSSKKNILEPLKLSNEAPEANDKLHLRGFPLGIGIFETEGKFIKTIEVGNQQLYLLSLQAAGGYSGSPVLNEYDEVVGVLILGVPSFTQMSFSTSLESLRDFIR